MAITVDLNADLGELPGPEGAAIDRALLETVTSASIACGFHAGNPGTMARTVEAAVARGVRIGAHPGLPDRGNFGRKAMRLSPDDVYNLVLYQIGALDAFTRRWGVGVSHVKPHGALYHMAEASDALAESIAYAVFDFRPALRLVGLSGGRLVQAGRVRGLSVMHEVFADRAYAPDGSLQARTDPGAMVSDMEGAARRMALLLGTGAMPAADGTPLALRADTISLHSDTPGADTRARILRTTLEASGITVAPPSLR